jgi:hypothetical protein
VRDGEYANGGHGPIAVDGRLYNTADEAAAQLPPVGPTTPRPAAIREEAAPAHGVEG